MIRNAERPRVAALLAVVAVLAAIALAPARRATADALRLLSAERQAAAGVAEDGGDVLRAGVAHVAEQPAVGLEGGAGAGGRAE